MTVLYLIVRNMYYLRDWQVVLTLRYFRCATLGYCFRCMSLILMMSLY